MKKISIFLFAIVAFAFTAAAQGKGRTYVDQIQPSFLFQRQSPSALEDMRNTYGRYRDNNIYNTVNDKITRMLFPVQIIDSIYNWQWDPLLYAWKIKTRTVNIQYDASSNKIHEEVESLTENNGWEITSQITYTYDAHNNQLSQLVEQWDGQAWVKYYEVIYTYDDYNNKTGEIVNYWSNGELSYANKYIYTYDSLQHPTGYTGYSWNGTDWSLSSQVTTTYDIYNNVTKETYQYWYDNTLVTSAQALYFYDINHYLIRILYQYWDDLNSEWHTSNHSVYSYDDQYRLIRIIGQNWDGWEWNSSSKSIFSYDDHDNLISILSQKWDGKIWINTARSAATYDSDNLVTGSSYIQFDDTGNLINYGDSTHYYFHIITATKDIAPDLGNILIYPNPTSGHFNISSQSKLSTIEVYNLAGEKIYSVDSHHGQNDFEINLAGYPKGMYMIRMRDGIKMFTRTIVLQ